MDIIKQQQKAEREEEERIKKEQENNYRLEQEKFNAATEEEEVEELEELKEEYLVYICQCCNRKFKTPNQFKNHIESKKHKDIARLYEEAGVSKIVCYILLVRIRVTIASVCEFICLLNACMHDMHHAIIFHRDSHLSCILLNTHSYSSFNFVVNI